MRNITLEAVPGTSYCLDVPVFNVPQQRDINLQWAVANVLHFFAETERAEPLLQYNQHATRFVGCDGCMRGAYGHIAVPQIRLCISELQKDLWSRRAVISMGDLSHNDINRPACWSFLHFLYSSEQLDLLVYQRSLNLIGVMPYDCIVLTNVLFYVADALCVAPGALRWTVGSLHMPLGFEPRTVQQPKSIVLDSALLASPEQCWRALLDKPYVESIVCTLT